MREGGREVREREGGEGGREGGKEREGREEGDISFFLSSSFTIETQAWLAC